MNKYLKEIITLNQYDKKIEDLKPIEANIKKPFTDLEMKKCALEEKLEKLEKEVQNIMLKRSKNELLIKELKDKLKEIEEKSGRVKTEKEAKALALEEELAKEQIDGANEEIERFEKMLDLKKEEKEEIKKETESVFQEIVLVENDIKSKLESLETQKEEIYKNRELLISEMSQTIYRSYEKIKRWAGITAVSPVKKQACMGCHMIINDKTYADVIKAEEIITCPNCGRVLFIEEESE